MKLKDFRLICVKDDNAWCVHPEPKLLDGLIVQVDNLEDAPKALARCFEAMLKRGFDKNIHIIKYI